MQRIGKNIFSLGFSRIFSGIVLFLVNIHLVRYLQPEGFGKFSLVMAYFFIFFLFVDLGISRFVIKRVSEDKSVAAEYLGNFFAAQAILALGAFAAFVVIPRVVPYDAEITSAMLLAGIGLVLAALNLPFSAVAQAWQKIHILALVNFVDTLVKTTWFILAIVLKKDLTFIFWMLIVVGVVDLITYWWSTKRLAIPEFRLEARLIQRMLFYGLPFAFVSGFEILIQKIDIVIQEFYLPVSEVGLYGAAYRFLDFLTFLPAVVAISLFPFFVERRELNTSEVRNTVNHLNRYLVILALPLGVGSTLLGEEIIVGLFGQEFIGAVLPFQILIWATVLTLVYAVPNVLLIVKKTKALIGVLAAVTILNIIFNIIYVPIYGIVASAWITVASYLLSAGVYIVLARKLLEFKLFGYSFWPIFASAIMGLALWYWGDSHVFLLIGVAAAIYLAILLAAGFLKKDDWVFLKSIFQRS